MTLTKHFTLVTLVGVLGILVAILILNLTKLKRGMLSQMISTQQGLFRPMRSILRHACDVMDLTTFGVRVFRIVTNRFVFLEKKIGTHKNLIQ